MTLLVSVFRGGRNRVGKREKWPKKWEGEIGAKMWGGAEKRKCWK